MEPIRLFYSWQSDIESALCRRFIASALDAAADRLKTERGIDLVIDSDTTGVSGTPKITDTILKRIDACDIFLTDMTFVGATAKGKRLPNPNIMAEYGYAISTMESERILLVMNTHFGPPEALPFDLRHMRFPTRYKLGPGQSAVNRERALTAFTARLASHIALAIDYVESTRAPTANAVEQARQALGSVRLLLGAEAVPIVVSRPRIRILLQPIDGRDDHHFDLRAIKALYPKFVPSGFAPRLWEATTSARDWTVFGPRHRIMSKPNPEAHWYTRIVRPRIFEQMVTIGHFEGDDPTLLIDGRKLESRIVHGVMQLVMLAREAGFAGSAIVGVELQGIDLVQLGGARSVGRAFGIPDLWFGDAILPALDVPDVDVLKPILDRIWLDAGFDEGSPSFDQGSWAGLTQQALYDLD